MYATITISNVGADVGPFNLYSDVDGFISAFDTDITTAQLTAGFFTGNVPDGTTQIKVANANISCPADGQLVCFGLKSAIPVLRQSCVTPQPKGRDKIG